MSLVSGSGGSERVTIDGQRVKRKINLITSEKSELISVLPYEMDYAFVFENELYFVFYNRIFKYNKSEKSWTEFWNLPYSSKDTCFFQADGNMYGIEYYYANDSKQRMYVNLKVFQLNIQQKEATQIFFKKYMVVKKAPNYIEPKLFNYFVYVHNQKVGGVVHYWKITYSPTVEETEVTEKIGTLPQPPITPPDLKNSTKIRRLFFNNKTYCNAIFESLNKFDMAVFDGTNWSTYPYKSDSVFNQNFLNGSLAIVDSKIFMYGGTSAPIQTKRVEWNNTYNEVEDLSLNESINETIILECENDLFFLTKNHLAKETFFYKET